MIELIAEYSFTAGLHYSFIRPHLHVVEFISKVFISQISFFCEIHEIYANGCSVLCVYITPDTFIGNAWWDTS